MGDLLLERIDSDSRATVGELKDGDGNHLCWTLENRPPGPDGKVWGQIRIKAGRYKLILRKHGGFYQRYTARYPWHKEMVELADVPEFSDILIHIGNTHKDTHGCILVGTTRTRTPADGFVVWSSVAAYEKLYPVIHAAAAAGGNLVIRDEVARRHAGTAV
ncbi:MAG: DUF5675 family protein [Glycocaulis sp.]